MTNLPLRSLLALTSSLLVLPVLAGASFSGTFLGEGNEKLVLQQQGAKVSGQVHVGGTKGKLDGTAAGPKLTGRVTLPWGDAAPFTATLKAGALHFQITGDPTVGVYRRVGGATAAKAAPAKAKAKVGTTGPPLTAKGGKASGRSYRAEFQGWGLKLAAGWNGKEQDGMLILGHQSEAGMIAVQATEERDPERLRAGLAEDLKEIGLLGPVPAFKKSRLPAGQALSVEFPVTSKDGGSLKVRAVGVVGKRGTVAVIGTTSPAHFPRLRLRVDAMARSVTFFQPKIAPGTRFIAGEWYSFTSVGGFTGGSGGTEASLAFCRDGSFTDSSESSYGGKLSGGGAWGIAGGPQGSRGKWRAEGGPAAGKVHVTYPNGNQRVIPYQAKQGSDGMYFDGRLYGKTGGGKACR